MESNGGSGEAPARCVIVAATAWQSASGIAAKVPAWRRPSWCGVVHSFVLFQCWVTPRFFDDYKSVVCGWVLRYCFDFVAVFEWRSELFGLRRSPNTTSLSHVFLSCAWRVLMAQSNPSVLFLCFLFFS